MKKQLILATLLAFTAASGMANAEDLKDNDGAVTGAAGGAITGAIVGGPVGAVVGGAVGLAAGAAIDPPPRTVVTYVEEQPAPATPIIIEEPIVVGKPLPQQVIVTPVPDNDAYAYAVVNDQRVIVNPQTNTVIQVLQ